jgi:hypothetical protein
MTPITTIHPIEACYGSRLHCFSHNLDESDANAFRVCLECGHVFTTECDLVSAYNAFLKILSAQELMFQEPVSSPEWKSIVKEMHKLACPDDDFIVVSPTHIEHVADAYSCPYCLHDF